MKAGSESDIMPRAKFYIGMPPQYGPLDYNASNYTRELLVMLKKCVPMFGLAPQNEKQSQQKKQLGLDFSIQLKDITVRIVHAGGREEHYRTAILASQLIKKYPGMCVARPEVFKNPHASILLGEEILWPGQKYYIIPSTTVQKLKRRHPENGKVKEPDRHPENGKVRVPDRHPEKRKVGPSEGKGAFLDSKVGPCVDGADHCEDSLSSAKDFYASKERWSGCLKKEVQKGRKSFVPPILKPGGSFRGLGWEPSLTSVQELSQ